MSSFKPKCEGDDYLLLLQILSCIVEIEKITAKLYKIIAKYFPVYISSLLLHIARESENHHDTLQSLKDLLDCEKFNNINCDYKAISILRMRLKEVEEADKKSELSNKDLIELFDYLVQVEQFASEEYYVMIIMPLLIERLQDAGIPTSYTAIWRWVLEEIAQEEKYHAKIAESIREYLETQSD